MSAIFSNLNVPSFISVSSRHLLLLDDMTPLHDDELASTAPMSPERREELSQCRWHARKALAQLGEANACLPVSANRSAVCLAKGV